MSAVPALDSQIAGTRWVSAVPASDSQIAGTKRMSAVPVRAEKSLPMSLLNSIAEQAALRQACCFFIGREDGQGEFCRKKFVPLDIS
ncbi:MAG: hypothetical protein C6W56_12470 [Caldibacillus debilis]|nr:MAG: hypothetical protein C6W56_12470 [Caldibacillus debilis]